MESRLTVIDSRRIVRRFLADLHPPLGDPGGVCQVVRRIKDEVSNPAQQQRLIQEVMRGDDLSNQEAFAVYDVDVESGNKLIRKMELGAHAQYRMDLRGVKVNDVRRALMSFVKQLDSLKQRNHPDFDLLSDDLQTGNKIEFEDPQTRLFVTFAATTPGTVKVITTYWKNRPGHPVPPSGGCSV